jgi:cysteine synthase
MSMLSVSVAEGKRKRHQTDSIIEGIGINRVVANLAAGLKYIDDAVKITDQEAVAMSRMLLANEGLFVGSSSAAHCVGVLKAASKLPKGSVIVTMLCDSGTRYLSNFYNDQVLQERGLCPTTPAVASAASATK